MKKILSKVCGFCSTIIVAMSSAAIVNADDVNTLSLSDATAVAGDLVAVELSINTSNLCAGYNLDIEFDNELTLKSVEGVMTTCTIDNVVSIVNFTGTYFKDDKVLSTLVFEVPSTAATGEEYDVIVSNITNFCTDCAEFENVVVNNSTITVLDGGEQKTLNYMTYVEEGDTTSTSVALRGDVNGDDKVDLYDAISVAKATIGKETLDNKQSFFGNVNEDEVINLYDIISICRYSMAEDKSWGDVIKI